MEDEVQLQSLAKRLINIYNACKWSKSKLHLHSKKRISRKTQDKQNFEEYTEVETESSARTVFVYNRNNEKKSNQEKRIIESTILTQYSERKQEDKNKIADNICEQYCNDQSINVCTCKRCCCDPGKIGQRNQVAARKSFENKKKSTSNVIICLKPREKAEASVSTKHVGRNCCCPDCAPQNYESSPPIKKKSSIKMPKPPLNNDYLSQSISTEIQIPSPPPSSSPISDSVTKNKYCRCAPTSVNTSSCCQCTPPKQDDFCYKSDCCKCPTSPAKTSECCQCRPTSTPVARRGCQCRCSPSPASRDSGEFPSEDNQCQCCQSVDTNNPTIVCTDKIIIPTCFFNEGEQRTASGNISLVVSEEVKNVLLDGNSSGQKSDSSDKQINTSGIIIGSSTHSSSREKFHDVLPTHVPVAIPPRVSSTLSINDCNRKNCKCHRKELHDQMINTSCVVVRSCTPANKRSEQAGHPAIHPPNRKCDGVCCSCQQNGQHGHPPVHPEHHVAPHNPDIHSPNRPMHRESRGHPNDPDLHSPSRPMHRESRVQPNRPDINSPSRLMHLEHHAYTDDPDRRSPNRPRLQEHRRSELHSPSRHMHQEEHVQPRSPDVYSPSRHMNPERLDYPHNSDTHPPGRAPHAERHNDHHNADIHSLSFDMHSEHNVHPRTPEVHVPNRPLHQEYQVHPYSSELQSPNRPMHKENPGPAYNSPVRSPNPPIPPRHDAHSPSLLLHSPNPVFNQEHHVNPPEKQARPPGPPMHPEYNVHPPNALIQSPSPAANPGYRSNPADHPPIPPVPHNNPAMHPVLTDNQVLRYPSKQNIVPSLDAPIPPYNNNVYPPNGEERMIANYSPQPMSDHIQPPYVGHMTSQMSPHMAGQINPHMAGQMSPVADVNNVGLPLYGGMVPPRRMDFTGSLLRSRSTPLCCKLLPKAAGGDQKIAGINDDTEAEIYATLQKIEISLRDEADSHSRNMRCIVDQVCRQAGQIKELKVLVTGVVEDKRAPTCKEVEKKIKKLEKRKEKEDEKKREFDLKDRERRKREGKEGDGSLQEIPSNLCCKCGIKKIRPMGCCGKCCAKRCFGCCGKCCKSCCPRCCNRCCAPFEKCCPKCCCGLTKCCDKCWSCKCCPRRKKKCSCSK